MQNVIKYFKTISSIPHCSGNTHELRKFIKEFCKSRNYIVNIDESGNILAKRENSKICFQAHYDMVCVGKAPNIEIYDDEGWIKSKNSSLGADNGIAIAIMMRLMDEQVDCEFLFTNDEEIGLIGASDLSFKLKSKYMLNLDSEDDSAVCIGCAGGFDLKAKKKYELTDISGGNFYEVTISGLKGGHSGVDIDKNIPNAIKVFADHFYDKDVKIVSIQAGERINSIPCNLKSILFSHGELTCEKNINIKKIDSKFKVSIDCDILDIIHEFKNGVLEFNDELSVVQKSINLALLDFEDGTLTLQASGRAMDDSDLINLEQEYTRFLKNFEMNVSVNDKYPAWKPEMNQFSKKVYTLMQEVFGKSKYYAIHAGLECAIIKKIYPDIQLASIGPNILSPHSIYEKVEIKSVEKIFEVIKKVAYF